MRGGYRENAGRPKGSLNKTTLEIRNAFQKFVQDNTGNFQKWLDRVAETNPAKALELVTNLSDFVLPKLQRTELKAETGETLDMSKLSDETLNRINAELHSQSGEGGDT